MGKEIILLLHLLANGIIAVAAIIGNLIIILVFIKFKELQNINNAAITILSLNGFVQGIAAMVFRIPNQARSYATILVVGEPMCTITGTLCAFTVFCCAMILVLIALMRYFIIVPWKNVFLYFTRTKFIFAVLILFSVAAVISTLPLMGVGRYRYSPGHGICFTDWQDDEGTFRIIFYAVMIGSFLILLVCYTTLLVVVRKYNRDLVANDQGSEGVSGDNAVIDLTNIEQQGPKSEKSPSVLSGESYLNTVAHKRISSQEAQITKVVLVILLTCLICWLPATVVNVLALAKWANVSMEVKYVVTTLVELESAVNPIIYGVGNKNYRYAVKKVVQSIKSFFKV